MHVLIVGASLAGLRTAESLRALGFDGDITMVGEEAHAPYDRPPLSKELLTGERTPAEIALRGEHGVRDLDVDLMLGRRAIGLDLPAREVALDDGATVSFDELVVATGARARTIPTLVGFENVFVLRTLDEALAIRAAMLAGDQVVVVGGGFIGSEVASSARHLGRSVTVLEAGRTPMNRVLAPPIGERLARLHTEAGSDLRCGALVERAVGFPRAEAVVLADGTRLPAEVVIVGAGSIPNTEWLRGGAIDLDDGVRCDTRGRVLGAPHMHAVGDVARWESVRFGDCLRAEHWSSAGDQAQEVAGDLLGLPAGDEAVPYVWSDQFGHRVQVGGRCRADDEVFIVDDGPRFLALTRRDDLLAAVVTVDDAKAFRQFRSMIASSVTWDDACTAAGR